jgi:DNA-binding transcriptional LysR family regulator
MGADPDYELFARVAELGSVSAAGRALGLSAPMASKRLARLETRLGVRLVNRTTRRTALTGAGQRFHEDVLAILAAIRDAEARLSGETVGPTGLLRVSAPTSFGRLHVAPHLKTFLHAYPEVELELNLSDAFSDLMDDGVDLAVRITRAAPAALQVHALAPNRRILCAAPAYLEAHGQPATLRDLHRHALLAAQGQAPWRLTSPEGAVAVDLKSRVRTNSSEVVRELVLAGVGVALRSLWDVSADLASGRLVRVLEVYEGSPDVRICAVHPRSPLTPPRVTAFIDFLRGLYLPRPPWETP